MRQIWERGIQNYFGSLQGCISATTAFPKSKTTAGLLCHCLRFVGQLMLKQKFIRWNYEFKKINENERKWEKDLVF